MCIMKKLLKGLGTFCSIILTIVLTIFIFAYALLLNAKFVVSENGMANTLKRLDIVETLKSSEDGTTWEDFKQLADKLNLSEEQFEKILNSNKIKKEIGIYVSEVLSSAFNEKEANLTKEKMENFLNIAVDEYNEVSDTKISDTERQKIISSFDEEMINNLNEEFSSINLTETVDDEYIRYIKITDNALFGDYTSIILVVIVLIVGLIALFRFSYYKWISNVKVGTIISGILMSFAGIILFIIPLQDMEIVMPIKEILAINIFITASILFVIAIILSVGKAIMKKHIDKNTEDNTIEETKEIVEEKEVINEKKKIDKKTIIIIILAIILFIVMMFLIFGKRSYTITFDTNGGTEISEIEVKNGEIVKLPEAPKKEGHKFVGWTNEEGKVITKGTKVTEDITLKAEWISNDVEAVTVEFDVDGGSEIDNIVIEKGKIVLLPIPPEKEGYIFVNWLDSNGNFVTEDTIITNNITLTAMWIKEGVQISTVKFDTDGGSNIGSIIVENGKLILLPVTPTKVGHVFTGWVDENGNKITKDTIVNNDISIKATWKEPYTCPEDCTPIGDGSKCTRTTTKDIVVYTGCPSGTETVERFCSAHKRQVAIGFDEDMTYETAGIICNGNPSGFCVDYKGRYTIAGDSCPSGYYKYVDSDGLGALIGCTKKYDKGGSGCPSGYKKDGDKCTKTETIKCKAN